MLDFQFWEQWSRCRKESQESGFSYHCSIKYSCVPLMIIFLMSSTLSFLMFTCSNVSQAYLEHDSHICKSAFYSCNWNCGISLTHYLCMSQCLYVSFYACLYIQIAVTCLCTSVSLYVCVSVDLPPLCLSFSVCCALYRCSETFDTICL